MKRSSGKDRFGRVGCVSYNPLQRLYDCRAVRACLERGYAGRRRTRSGTSSILQTSEVARRKRELILFPSLPTPWHGTERH